jgi:hypothetical protein
MAWQSAPPRVPRLRTGGSAMTRSASRKIEQVPQQLGLEELPVPGHRADPYDVAVRLDVAEGVAGR